ncbi:transmembrane channel-like protein 7 isoform X2 [Brienomyrus brachyistius]|uniref:transmembrane channel-like protein 7 isoform X2 n=1 Tax=Brienomyrus brachyistius TaxID=42636 RepID=UPI0020B3566C|nr:transmembrane channel-like protein 7 isoform X2 [Brienomyrus brachyistius]
MYWARERETSDAGHIHYSPHQSLRLRERPSNSAVQRPPQFNWNTDQPEEGAKGRPRNLKELPLPMELKKAIRQVQQMKVPVMSNWQSWKISKSKTMKRFLEESREVLAYVAPWRRTLHKIGGHFGGGVQSYFLFLRFLVVLNFLSFLLIAGFVLAPSIVFQSSPGNSETQNSIDRTECMIYSPEPQSLSVFYQYFLDLLTGMGFMEYSYLFYGFYNNTEMMNTQVSYNIPVAYLLTTAFYFIFCLICIVLRMGAVIRDVVKTGGGAVGGYSTLVFTAWDYGLQGNRATNLKQNNIRYQLQMDLEEERIRKVAASLTMAQTMGLYSLRAVLNLVVFGLIGGAFYAIFKATQFSQSQTGDNFLHLIVQYLPSIVITAANFLVPFLCDKIALLEKHSPSTTVILALLRAVFLRLVSLGVLLFTLWSGITCNGVTENTACSVCQYNHKQYQCWETRVGQEMYKLAVFDFITVIAVMILVEFPRRMLVDHCPCKLAQFVGRQEFVVPQNVLGLVYGQTVVWTGALFCPLLPAINTIKFIIIFYCRKITLFQNCRPADRTFRSNSSNFFFLLVLLLGWSLATVALIYAAVMIHPSMSCGPFRFLSMMWSVVPDSLQTLSNSSRDFLYFMGSQAFCIPLFVSLCVVLCYIAALASVYGKTVSLLRSQLKMEGRDKQFLVKKIKELNSANRRNCEAWNPTSRDSFGTK